jgi:hypothetical protein
VFGSTSIVLLYVYTAEVATKRELLIVPESEKKESGENISCVGLRCSFGEDRWLEKS